MSRFDAGRASFGVLALVATLVVWTVPSMAQVDRCAMHRAIGRDVPAECGGVGQPGGLTRGRVVIGQPDAGTPAAGAATPARPPVAGATPVAPPRQPPTRGNPYGVSLAIQFEHDSDVLGAQATRTLDDLADVIKRNDKDRFVIEGHTDAHGTDDYNQRLSDRRAAAAVDYLASKHGIPRDRLEAVGVGRGRPLVPALPYDARNRRVQILNVGA